MGCDIHAYMERKNAHNEWELVYEREPDGRWWFDTILDEDFYSSHLLDNLIILETGQDPHDALADKLRAYSKEQVIAQYGNDPRVCWDWKTPACFDNRNYALFGILAGVRNYDEAPRISDPRGLPDDTTAFVQTESNGWGRDGHSHSWVTLQELVDFRWNDSLIESGLVEEKHYTPGQRPQSYCRGVGGGGTVVIQESEWIKTKKEPDKRYYINSSWEVDLKDHIGDYWLRDFKNLLEEFEGEDLNNIRVVFFFDN